MFSLVKSDLRTNKPYMVEPWKVGLRQEVILHSTWVNAARCWVWRRSGDLDAWRLRRPLLS